ncbi:DnaJ sub B member 6, partial [Coemansia sp. RSA 2399]
PELRQRYDEHGEDGLKRNFQPNAGASYSSAANGTYGGPHTHPGFAFSFSAADDMFRQFFGGRDPFGPMFATDPFFGSDPFADAFFSQAAGPGGMRANVDASSSHAPIERERRPYSGSGFSMFGGGGGGGGGFHSMFEASFGGSSGAMPPNGSFSFMSSSTMGGNGGLRGSAGPSVRSFVQISDGVKLQISEEDDGNGNVTVTKVTPDGRKEITVNGVPQQQQQQQQQSSGRHRINNQQDSDRRSRNNSYEKNRGRSRNGSGNRSSTAYSSSAQPQTQRSRYDYGHDTKATQSSDEESVVDIDVVELDSTSSDDERYRPGAEPSQRNQQYNGTTHKAPGPSEYAPPPKRPETNKVPVDYNQTHSASSAAKTAAATAAGATTGAALGGKDTNPYIPQRNEAEDILATARNKLKPTSGGAPAIPGSRIHGVTDGQPPNIGIKDRLKATGASMLRSRPKINRTAPPSPRFSAPSQSSAQSINDGRPRGTVHRPSPLSAAELKAGHGYDNYMSAQYQQPPANQQASFSDYASQNPQVASYRNPSVAANIPPPPAQSQQAYYPQQTYQHAQPPLQTLPENQPQMHSQRQQQNQAPSGHSTPGHKQPRSRDRMRSTLHYDSFASLNAEAAKAAQIGASTATLSTQPPQPQLPLGARTTAPNYSQQPNPQTYGQATFVDP